jgi:hypothetical protein
VFGVRCWPPAADDDIFTAMSGEEAAGGGFSVDPGKCEGGAWGVLHVLAGYQVSEGGLRAVCRCGQTGPPRTAADRAAAALDGQHQLDLLQCGICERQRAPATILRRPEEVGLVIRPAVGGPRRTSSTWPARMTWRPVRGWPLSSRNAWSARLPRPMTTAAGCSGGTCDWSASDPAPPGGHRLALQPYWSGEWAR